jgi:hypothetical protein
MSINKHILLFALVLLASVVHALDLHAESSEPSICSNLKPDSAIDEDYVREITDLGFPRSAERTIASWSFAIPLVGSEATVEMKEDGRLLKWARNPRIVVLTNERIPSDLALSMVTLRHEIAALLGRDQIPDIVWQPSPSFDFEDGDLAILLSSHLGSLAQTNDARLLRLLRAFFESDEKLDATVTKLDPAKPRSFTQLIGESFRVDRAIVLLDADQAPFSRSHELFQLLTFAIHPSADALNWESSIYRPEFRSQRQLGSPWAEDFRAYLALVLDSDMEAGMSRPEFAKAASELLRDDQTRRRLGQAFHCDP